MNSLDFSQPIEILLVEDNPGDVDLIMDAFNDGRIVNHLNVVEDGGRALAFLRREDPFGHVPRPDLILLDLNLPGIDGFEVLTEIKRDETFRRIPVVVLTTSTADKDILKSYDLRANAYVAKPLEINDFINAIRSIENFWLTLVKFPRE